MRFSQLRFSQLRFGQLRYSVIYGKPCFSAIYFSAIWNTAIRGTTPQGYTFKAPQILKANDLLNFNNFKHTRPILDLNISLDIASLKHCLKKKSSINLDSCITIGIDELHYPYAGTPDLFRNNTSYKLLARLPEITNLSYY